MPSVLQPSRPPAFAVGAIVSALNLRASAGWWLLALLSIAVNAVVTGIVAFTHTAPAFAFDEIHQLLMARMVAGFPAPDGSGAGYYPAWGVLLAPVWWILDDPRHVYSAALAIAWLVGVSTIFPLALLVRRMRLPMPHALVVAAVISTLPARVAEADNVFSERLLFLFVVLTALAAFRLWERPSHLRAAMFGLAVAATYFTHIRMLTLVLASIVWAVGFALKHLRVSITALISLIAGYAAAEWLGSSLDEALRRTPGSRGSSFLDSLAETRPGLLLRTVLGQLWAQIVGSYGLFAIGIVILVVLCLRELRRLRLGRATWLAGALAATFAVSVLTWAHDKRLYADIPRLDAWTYGRYMEPVTALVCALALGALLRRLRAYVWIWTVVVFIAVAVPALVWLAPQAPTGGLVTPAHIGGLMPWSWTFPDHTIWPGVVPSFVNANSFWLWASATSALCLTVFFAARRLAWFAPVLLLVLTSVGAAGVNAASDDYRDAYAPSWNEFAPLVAVTQEFSPLNGAYEYNCGRDGRKSGVGMNQLSYALLPDVRLAPYFRDDSIPVNADFVLGCADSKELVDLGALPLEGFEAYQSVAWILPGALFDELDKRGALDNDFAG